MANYRAVANGNWSSGATWGGGAVPPDAAGHNIYSNGFTVTIDQNVNVNLITNAAITASFVDGGTSAAAGGGFAMTSAFDVNGSISGSQALIISTTSGTINLNAPAITPHSSNGTLRNNGAGDVVINNCNITGAGGGTHVNIINASSGNIIFNTCTILANGGAGGAYPVQNVSTATGTLTFNNCTLTGGGNTSYAVGNFGAGSIVTNNSVITGSTSSNGPGILSSGTGSVNCQNSSINAGSTGVGISNGSGQLTCTNCSITASNGNNGITSSGVPRISGTLTSSPNGFQVVNSARWILNTTPTNAYIQHALNGINANSFVRFYTADNNLGQANPTDVRSGVSYASGTLTGRLTVPARGSVPLSVNYGPSMPFTATRSGTTATATLAYTYPLVAGDQITVTGASNSEWNSTYTIASVVSGTSVTFVVPNTHSATAGTGALMQTTGTAVLDPASIASAVQSALTAQGLTSARAGNLDNLDAAVSSRLAPSGTLATVTNLTNAPASVTPADIWSHPARTITGGTVDTLTNAPTVPSASAIAGQVRTELATELGRIDAAISTRATPANIPTADITAIKGKTDLLNTTRLAQVSTTEIVGNLLAQANS